MAAQTPDKRKTCEKRREKRLREGHMHDNGKRLPPSWPVQKNRFAEEVKRKGGKEQRSLRVRRGSMGIGRTCATKASRTPQRWATAVRHPLGLMLVPGATREKDIRTVGGLCRTYVVPVARRFCAKRIS